VPAQLQGWIVRAGGTGTLPGVVLHATCAPLGSCQNFMGPVSEETAGQLNWRVDAPATITVISPERPSSLSIPVENYRLFAYTHSHPPDRICTAESLYCYEFVASYELVDSYVPDLSSLDPDDPLAHLAQGYEKIIEEGQKPGFVGDKLRIFIAATGEQVDVPPEYVTAEVFARQMLHTRLYLGNKPESWRFP
jgi:hypothetical protein